MLLLRLLQTPDGQASALAGTGVSSIEPYRSGRSRVWLAMPGRQRMIVNSL
jgi:hypothetical protein